MAIFFLKHEIMYHYIPLLSVNLFSKYLWRVSFAPNVMVVTINMNRIASKFKDLTVKDGNRAENINSSK